MDKAEVNAYMAQNAPEEVIQKFEDEVAFNYDEYTMLKLAETYIQEGNQKEAKRVVKKMQRLFPQGEYVEETENLKKQLNGEAVSEPAAMPGSEQTSSEELEPTETGMTMETAAEPEELTKEQSEEQSNEQSDEQSGAQSGEQSKEESLMQSIDEYFSDIVGLKSVKEDLKELCEYVCFKDERQEQNFQQELLNTHFIVTGSRGSGKSMVGGIIAKFLCAAGVRSSEEPVFVKGDTLNSLEKGGDDVEKLFKKNKGKTIIFENVEGLSGDEILCLVELLDKYAQDVSVVLTGTYEAIQGMQANEATLKNAFYPKWFQVPDYSPEELVAITEKLALKKKYGLKLEDEAKEWLVQQIEKEYKNPLFLNSYTLDNYLDKAVVKASDRIAAQKKEEGGQVSQRDLVYLKAEDFEADGLAENTIDELMAQLNALTGLGAVKDEIKKLINTIQVENRAREAGSQRKSKIGSLHMLFLGNPGTGKTTVARLIGKMYHALGLLSNGHTVECTRKDLVGEYVGSTAPLVKKKVNEAMGGVLFIDEAYSLVQGTNGHDTFGMEAVDTLVSEIENNRGDLVVIMAGYPKEMEEFLESNVGLASRFRRKITFEDYTTEEMVDIFKGMVQSEDLLLDEDCEDMLYDFIHSCSRKKDFGNARGVRNVFEDVKEAMNTRIASESSDNITDSSYYDRITSQDLEHVLGNGTEDSIDDLMAQLNELTGLESVKNEIKKLIDTIQVENRAKEAGAQRKSKIGSLHMLFLGNPGTGKTTVARLIGKMYRALGVLSDGQTVECTRKDLVGEYTGSTAPLVKKKVDEAIGGVLFIDEAYSLVHGTDGRDTFGLEAVDALVSEMENNRENLVVIMAGYPEEMEDFLKNNVGLDSRFRRKIMFEDYTTEEMVDIFKGMVQSENLLLDEDCEDILYNFILSCSKKKNFGNARGVRNVFENVKEAMNTRIAAESPDSITDSSYYDRITRQDLEHVLGNGKLDSKNVDQLLEELDSMIGLKEAKKQVRTIINSVRVRKVRQERGLQAGADQGTLHLVFEGNAGTGKTVVARLLGQIYTELGVLKKDVFVEAHRADLVGEYQGATAQKVQEKIKDAEGGILFIDEAYTLYQDEKDSFGKEAIDELVAAMENMRDNLMVIVAGYPNDMEKFLSENQGLSSRLAHKVMFEDYTLDEMVAIYFQMISQRGMKVADGLDEEIKELINNKKNAQNDFGNARGVRNLLEDTIRCQENRIANELNSGAEPSEDELITITKEDIESV